MAGDDIVFQFGIETDRDAVVDAVATSDGVAGWWTDVARVSDRPGGRAELEFPGAVAPYAFTVEEVGPDRVAWAVAEHPREWDGTRITYEMSDDGATTTLFFRHGGFRDDPSRAIPAYIWGQLMPLLKAYAETGERRPFFRN